MDKVLRNVNIAAVLEEVDLAMEKRRSEVVESPEKPAANYSEWF